MATAQENKHRLEAMAKNGYITGDREAAAWALREIEFLQNKCKELRALIPLEPEPN